MSRTDNVYKPALEGKNIPILTLDNKWHQLFVRIEKTETIIAVENELNELLRRQGKLNSELKEIKALKKKLMDDIMLSADILDKDPNNKKEEKKLEESKRLLNDCNTKMEEDEDELIDLPRSIYKKNQELMLATMEICYDEIHENAKEIEEISAWILEMRKELKKKIIRKQEGELKNKELYAYMHDIFGPSVIELFDIQAKAEEKKD
ncbi:MAG: hypothetical protein IKJ15_05045 [Lachnospiraceae bacterium]|nr:hypothetical protein [Lachnospiraceae bacterium]